MMPISKRVIFALTLTSVTWVAASAAQQSPPLQGVPTVADPATYAPLATRIDPYVPKPRVIVMTDIANEPDDQMSFVRLLVSSNQFDIEGLVATTSRHLRSSPRPDVLRSVIDAYRKVQANLAKHEAGFPTADALAKLVVTGQDSYGMAAVGEGHLTPGAEAIIRAADATDPRPVWITVWGGANTLAQGLWQVRATRTAADLERFVTRLRVYTISDQDDAGPWLRREFPTLHYIATPGDANDYHVATWTGIAGDEFYRNGAGADFTTVSPAWVDEHMRKKGPLGPFYPTPCCIIEGDTPSFLGLMNNGLVSYMNPTFGGWGGRYVWRQPWLETRPYWTNSRASRDTVVGNDGKSYTSDQATIWRWREAFQHDFAARMDWTVKDVGQANHNPDLVVNGIDGKAPLMVNATVGTPVTLDASKSRDRDGNTLRHTWFFYPEAGSGLPNVGGGRRGGGPGAPPPPRVTVTNGATAVATVMPNAPGVAHVILAVSDNGTPSLTSYRRIILTIQGDSR
jgi:Cellulose-binding Sde182, nucleoside hydrolase-like domain/Cellulose-binding protein Sde0182, C-terminal domain